MLLFGLLLCALSILLHIALLFTFRAIVQAANFSGLQPKDVWSAANWLVSLLQACVATTVGYMAVMSTNNDLLDTRVKFLAPYAWFSLGYWLYDLVCLFVIVTGRSERGKLVQVWEFLVWWPGIVLHHLGIILFLGLGIIHTTRTRGDGIIGFSLLMEFSSIFVAFRSFLGAVGLKRARVYLVAGILMVAAFFVSRVLLLPYIINLYSAQVGLSLLDGVLSLPLKCSLGSASFYCLNMYWFMLMLRGCVRAARGSTSEHKNNQVVHKNNNKEHKND